MTDLKNAGLFLHWGMSTGNPDWENTLLFNSFEEFEEKVNNDGWCADKWIKAAKQVHASYITLACFHGAQGYIKAWRSKIAGTYTTKRDFLSELIEAGEKENIKILLYISGDTTWKEHYKGHIWVDAKAYGESVGNTDIDITDHDTWQTYYCKEVIEELMDNYPKLGGFWFDGWFEKHNAEGLFKFIHEKNPKVLTVRNNFGKSNFDNEDLMSIEQFGKVYDHYDIVNACWQGDTEAELCYTMDELSDWWYTGDYPDYFGTDTVKKYITIAANGWMPKVGIGPKAGGDFPKNTERFLILLENYLSWAEGSLFNTKKGIIPQCDVSEGGYIVTTYKPDEKLHYVHVLTAPSTGTLIIKDAGIDFKSAKNYKTGENIEFTQSNGEVIIKTDFSSAETDGDFVIELLEEKSRVFIEEKVSKGTLPCDITLDFGKKQHISAIVISQPDTSCSKNGSWAGPDNQRLKEYEIVGIDENGKEASLKCGKLNGRRGNDQININADVVGLKIKSISAYNTSLAAVYDYPDSKIGWRKLGYKDVISFTYLNGAEYEVAKDGTLLKYENKEETVINKDSSYVFAGLDNEIYYITRDKRIVSLKNGDTGFVGEKAAADADGNIYRIVGNDFYKNNELIDSNVSCMWIGENNHEYCKGNKVIDMKNNTVNEFDYEFSGITERNFLLKSGEVLLRDEKRKDDTFFADDASQIIYSQGKIYIIKPERSGKCIINKISVAG